MEWIQQGTLLILAIPPKYRENSDEKVILMLKFTKSISLAAILTTTPIAATAQMKFITAEQAYPYSHQKQLDRSAGIWRQ